MKANVCVHVSLRQPQHSVGTLRQHQAYENPRLLTLLFMWVQSRAQKEGCVAVPVNESFFFSFVT